MPIKSSLVLLGTLLLAIPAMAGTPPGQALNLELPPSDIPAAPASSPAAASSAGRRAATRPGVYYGDTSGRGSAAAVSDAPPPCDDSTRGQPRVHGSVGMGVVAGSHVSGNYQTGSMRYDQAFGSCDHPTGHVSISVGVGQGHFGDPR